MARLLRAFFFSFRYHMAMIKRVPIRFLYNARDLGRKYHDVTVRRGMLYRGKALRHLLHGERHTLVKWAHLRTIIDLRSHVEMNEKPDVNLTGVKILPFPVFEQERAGITHQKNKRTKDEIISIYDHLPPMEELYASFLRGESLRNLAKSVSFIVNAKDEDFAIYFHCSEGKDRTGVLAAILLLILGVSRKEIEKDYLRTNRVSRMKARAIYIGVRYFKRDLRMARKMFPFFIARLAYLAKLFDIIEIQYGGDPNRFFKEGLGLTQEEIEKFRRRMIVPNKKTARQP